MCTVPSSQASYPAPCRACLPACPQASILRVLLDTAAGLDYLHSIGVVHGDLKGANVLLKGSSKDARGVTCKITDFGLSRVLDMDATHISTGTYGGRVACADHRVAGCRTLSCNTASVVTRSFKVGLAPLCCRRPPACPCACCRHDCVHAQGAAAVRPHDAGRRHLLLWAAE